MVEDPISHLAIYLLQTTNRVARLFQFLAPPSEASFGQKREEQRRHIDDLGGADAVSAFDEVIGEPGLRRDLCADLDTIGSGCLAGVGEGNIARKHVFFDAEHLGKTV